ncbi:hypothetical protein KIPB_013118 [Kipferlia bialata]|uniref:Uncharacterized protein n=1 Tax=Kipferlia bialata TaxID=797122 RepID=A0A391NS30_9EUKA|nr:hypothetical protein KIPB_013118 [Kipferlia bialata]|eukprot:g13118.t1
MWRTETPPVASLTPSPSPPPDCSGVLSDGGSQESSESVGEEAHVTHSEPVRDPSPRAPNHSHDNEARLHARAVTERVSPPQVYEALDRALLKVARLSPESSALMLDHASPTDRMLEVGGCV